MFLESSQAGERYPRGVRLTIRSSASRPRSSICALGRFVEQMRRLVQIAVVADLVPGGGDVARLGRVAIGRVAGNIKRGRQVVAVEQAQDPRHALVGAVRAP